ncbi:RNA polymerase sigma factor [Breznakia pachnodae]|uniref:RNA polymerase sigma factor (Sigma-70 family) n=1 Tax=Breznakia pachnodae TaxID=265178 RepID=A0ABU0E217_9FIRM|nr:RNA polymerase sigma factor [Breznakia pachnodae]MDQ0360925.1 RNA polymerase sigma factor (sigma-70 family) [Breznakia pachnodae]
MNKVELTQIVKEVQKDIGQFELLYSQIIKKVYFWCFTIVKNKDDAEDVAQESMLKIYKEINSLKSPEAFNSWMYRLVTNTCYRYVSKSKNKEVEFLQDDNYSRKYEDNIKEERRDNLPHEAYELKETKRLITMFIQNLPAKQQEVITLFYLEEFKINEIAEILEDSVGTIKSRLYSGRKDLEMQIKEYEEENKVRLYGFVWFPLVGVALHEYLEEVCKDRDLSYDRSFYELTKGYFLSTLTGKLIISITGIVIIGILLIFLQPPDNKVLENHAQTSSLLENVEMQKKLNGHPYIEDVAYSVFPTRTSVEITITLKKDISDQDFKILFNNESINFERDNMEIKLYAEENGEYTVITKTKELSFEINSIDEYAPELIGANNNDGYLLLEINDEKSQLDYQKSFIEHEGQTYELSENLKFEGEFSGLVKVTLVNNEGYFIRYNLNFEK